MRATLPEQIDPLLFCTLDGRRSTEADLTLAAAISIAATGRNIKDHSVLRRAVVVLLLHAHSLGWPLETVCPTLGVLAGAFDRGIFRGSIKRRLVGFLLRRLYSIQENRVSRNLGADNPGWNDYSLAVWGMTGSDLQIEELHRRAASDPHALWLVNVCRNEIPDFDEQLKALETRLGAPIPPMDPVTGVGLRRSI